MDNDKKELCTIRIMFPVESDNQAMGVKKQITSTLSDIEGVQIQFTLMGMPDGNVLRPSNQRPVG